MGGLTFGAVCQRPGAVSYGGCLGEKAINGNGLRDGLEGDVSLAPFSLLIHATLSEQVNDW